MRNICIYTSLLALALSLLSCDKTPHGVLSVDDMADLIVDLQIADAYIESHIGDYPNDSSKMVLKQSIFKKHGITLQDYDSSLVWYAHNMEDYTKAYDKALTTLNKRHEKIKNDGNNMSGDEPVGVQGMPTHAATPGGAQGKPRHLNKMGSNNVQGDTTDMWQGKRRYMLTQGAQRGFITFDLPPDAGKQRGDRYQLTYKLTRGGNEFKVSLNIDYADGGTSQISRGTNSDGWVNIDVQSDSARQVRRVYGYLSYNIKRGHTAYVDSVMLIRTHLNKNNYGYIHAQRNYERNK